MLIWISIFPQGWSEMDNEMPRLNIILYSWAVNRACGVVHFVSCHYWFHDGSKIISFVFVKFFCQFQFFSKFGLFFVFCLRRNKSWIGISCSMFNLSCSMFIMFISLHNLRHSVSECQMIVKMNGQRWSTVAGILLPSLSIDQSINQ